MENWIDQHGMTRKVNDIFISYSQANFKLISLLVERLKNENLIVFWDRDIPAGVDYQGFLRKVLDNSRLVLVVWSDASVISDWVYSEAEYARVRNRLISCRIDRGTPSPPFNTFQTVDLSNWGGNVRNDNWRILVDLIRSRLMNGSAKTPIGDATKSKNADRQTKNEKKIWWKFW